MSTVETKFKMVNSPQGGAGAALEQSSSCASGKAPTRRKRLASLVKRLVDLSVAVVLLVLGAPLMLLIAVIVAGTSNGGALFVQERVGKDGQLFRVFKFRTMREGTFEEVMSDPELRSEYESNNFKLADTDRHITRVGLFLRKASLDELPQLWNVVKGEMSLVGVRPLVPAELSQRPPFDQVLYAQARPGLTGLWQVAGRSEITGSDRLALDRAYAEDWSLVGDLKILLRTPAAVLRVRRTV